jgi:hypothetical protein
MKIHFIGKKYIDTIVHTDTINLSETNSAHKIEHRLGGMYNVENVEGIDPLFCPVGQKEATIISEITNSRRTSFVRDRGCSHQMAHISATNLSKPSDWLHVIYIDDMSVDVARKDARVSIDFCTTEDRSRYIDIIEHSSIVFDSRERKPLYKDIHSTTPIIFHDEHGCEAILMGTVIKESKIEPIKNLQVNGAGDIFAAIFIREYLLSDISNAIDVTPHLTTQMLRNQTNEI